MSTQTAPSPPATPAETLPEKFRPLQAEILTYRRELPRLLDEKEAGRFVVIRGEQLLGTWDTYRDALQHGYDRLGDLPFMVQKIDPRDTERLDRLLTAQANACPSSPSR